MDDNQTQGASDITTVQDNLQDGFTFASIVEHTHTHHFWYGWLSCSMCPALRRRPLRLVGSTGCRVSP
eukprot:1511399-Amphidinium_carterae.1